MKQKKGFYPKKRNEDLRKLHNRNGGEEQQNENRKSFLF